MSRLVAVLFALFVTSVLAAGDYRRVSNDELLHEKHGRVVDANTGVGIANVTVIATWDSSASGGWSGSGGGCELAKFAKTDANGAYVIPDISAELDVSHRHDSPKLWWPGRDNGWLDYSWRLILYAPGYLREGDAEAFERSPLSSERRPIPGNSHYALAPVATVEFPWKFYPPRVTSVDKVVEVAPVRVIPAKMDALHEIVYYNRILRAVNNCGVGRSPPEVAVLQEDMRRRIREVPCSLPSSTVVGADIVSEYMFILSDATTFQRLDDAGFLNRCCPPYFKKLEAGALCSAATGEALDSEHP